MSESDASEKPGKPARPRGKKLEGEPAVLAKIEETQPQFRAMSERLHAIVTESAPHLEPRLFYGMPAYARDGKVVCFFRAPAANEKHPYMTLGITENSNLELEEDASDLLRESAWYFTELDDATEARIAAIVAKAAS